MDPIYLLLLIFVPVPGILLYAIIVVIYDRKKQSIFDFNHLQSEKLLGQAYFDLGILHKSQKRNDKAKECLEKAIHLLRQTDADVYLKQANEVLDSLA